MDNATYPNYCVPGSFKFNGSLTIDGVDYYMGERMTIAGHIVRIGSSTQFRVDPRDFQNAE